MIQHKQHNSALMQQILLEIPLCFNLLYLVHKKTWHDMLRDDLQTTNVSWEEARSVAGHCKERRALITRLA